MKALVLDGGTVALQERPTPVPADGEALVRVSMAGICSTDLEIARGYMGYRGVLGHEFCGVVEQASDARWVGRRVVGEINLACGRCDLCARKLGRHCAARTVLGIVNKDGCFAEHVTLPLQNLHRVPDDVPDEAACFAEPIAAAFEILEQLTVDARERVVVLGDGKLALLCAQVLASTGCELTVVGKHARKLELAQSWGLRTSTLDALSRKSFDVVVEATGSPSGMQAAIELARPRGTIVLKSTYHGALTLDAAPLVIDELHVVGSRCGPFPPALIALQTGAVKPHRLIDATYPLARGATAFEHAARPGVLKVLLDMRG